jgi:hypothetical protein
MYSADRLDLIKRSAQAMQRRGEDPVPMLRKELGAKSAAIGAMQADLLLAAMGIPTTK